MLARRGRSAASSSKSAVSSAMSPARAMRSGFAWRVFSTSASLFFPNVLPCRSVISAMRKPSNPAGRFLDGASISVSPSVKFPAHNSPAVSSAAGSTQRAPCDFFAELPISAPPSKFFSFYHSHAAKKSAFENAALQIFHKFSGFWICSSNFYCDMRGRML